VELGSVVPLTGVIKRAFAYKLNDFAAVINAGTVLTDTSVTLPVVSRLIITPTMFSAPIARTISRISYYNKRLTNLQIQLLSA
jgi:hypothetical protein